jgi:hypothetical protein
VFVGARLVGAARRRVSSGRNDRRFARPPRLGLLRHAGSRALPAPIDASRRSFALHPPGPSPPSPDHQPCDEPRRSNPAGRRRAASSKPRDHRGAPPKLRRRRGAPGAHASPRAALDRRRSARVAHGTTAACGGGRRYSSERVSWARPVGALHRRVSSGRNDRRFARPPRLGLLRHAGSRALPAPIDASRRSFALHPPGPSPPSPDHQPCDEPRRSNPAGRRRAASSKPRDHRGAPPKLRRRRGAPGAHASPRAALDRRRGARVAHGTTAARRGGRRRSTGITIAASRGHPKSVCCGTRARVAPGAHRRVAPSRRAAPRA